MMDTNASDPNENAKPTISVVTEMPKSVAMDVLRAQLDAHDEGARFKTDKAVVFAPRSTPDSPGRLATALGAVKKAAAAAKDRIREEKFIIGFNHQKPDKFLFNPHPEGLEPLKSPLDYAELEPYAVSERKLVTQRGLTGAKSSITLWEKKAEPGKPHVFYFTGKTGHIADTGPLTIPPGTPEKDLWLYQGYERDAGLKFLAELAKNGAGFTVVTMDGYGNNAGTPSEASFVKSMKALVADWKNQPGHPPADQIVVAGYSMGTANAAIMAEEMALVNEPPAMLCLANGFSSMIRRSKEFLDAYLKDPENPKLKPYKGLDLSEETIKNRMLKHPLNTSERIQALPPQTTLCIAYSTHDEMVDNSHSKRLISQISEDHPYIKQVFDNCGHLNVPAEMLARNLIQAYEFVKSPQGQQNVAEKRVHAEAERIRNTHDGEYMKPHHTTVEGLSWAEIAQRRAADAARTAESKPATSYATL